MHWCGMSARAPSCQRAHGDRPHQRGKNVSMIGAIGLNRVITQYSLQNPRTKVAPQDPTGEPVPHRSLAYRARRGLVSPRCLTTALAMADTLLKSGIALTVQVSSPTHWLTNYP
ncbi:hypothetical protein [Tolypothrix sp. VBCCA 56010]|uniref:hypothetical protein n=1 Tax=Tolypothrix sp. VBCCA 56010 TaxID=3137731 RepID=UPI003D7F127D